MLNIALVKQQLSKKIIIQNTKPDMTKLPTYLLTLTLVYLSMGSLEVYMPVCATTEITQPINYTLANFGHILYGRTIIGEIIIPKNAEFCNFEETQSFASLQSEDVRKFVLIKRGDCKFTKKILNAQKRGADLVIVYDNIKGLSPSVVMSNDGHGHLIDIPSVFISNADGQKLIKTYEKCNKNTILKIHFDVFVAKTANLTLWLDINNRESFITIRDFYHDYYKVMEKYVDIDVKFKINLNCGRQICLPEDCIKNKQQYCLHTDKTVGGVPIQGKQIVGEHLRSYFLFKSMQEKKQLANWFEYMNKFDESLCAEKLDIRDCSLNILKVYDSVDVIEGKVTETYNNVNAGKDSVLDQFVNDAYTSDILFYPEASINGRNFYGLFRAPDIFQMICQSLQRPPKQCHSFTITDGKQIFGNDPSSGLWKTILLIIIFALLLFFAALFIYNRLIRREMNQQMSMEVNKMVEHYVAMTEEKSRSNAAM